jgi:very-short-patch-repair endonuclease
MRHDPPFVALIITAEQREPSVVSEEKRYVHNIPAARRLRREQTSTEAALWAELRDRRLGGYKFRRQHAIQAYVLDFFCPATNCAIEIDGPIHDSPAQSMRDLDSLGGARKIGDLVHPHSLKPD